MKAIKIIITAVLFAWALINTIFFFGVAAEGEHFTILPNLLAMGSFYLEYKTFCFLSKRGLTFSHLED